MVGIHPTEGGKRTDCESARPLTKRTSISEVEPWTPMSSRPRRFAPKPGVARIRLPWAGKVKIPSPIGIPSDERLDNDREHEHWIFVTDPNGMGLRRIPCVDSLGNQAFLPDCPLLESRCPDGGLIKSAPSRSFTQPTDIERKLA